MQDLPVDCIGIIFAHLTPLDLSAARRTCHALNIAPPPDTRIHIHHKTTGGTFTRGMTVLHYTSHITIHGHYAEIGAAGGRVWRFYAYDGHALAGLMAYLRANLDKKAVLAAIAAGIKMNT